MLGLTNTLCGGGLYLETEWGLLHLLQQPGCRSVGLAAQCRAPAPDPTPHISPGWPLLRCCCCCCTAAAAGSHTATLLHIYWPHRSVTGSLSPRHAYTPCSPDRSPSEVWTWWILTGKFALKLLRRHVGGEEHAHYPMMRSRAVGNVASSSEDGNYYY